MRFTKANGPEYILKAFGHLKRLDDGRLIKRISRAAADGPRETREPKRG